MQGVITNARTDISNLMSKKKYKIQKTSIRKCAVIIVLKDGTIISGKGTFEGKKIGDKALLTAWLVKNL